MTPDLFDRRHFAAIRDARVANARVRRTDPETSVAAARQAQSRSEIGRTLALKLLSIRAHTDHELAAMTGYLATSIGVRRNELVRRGFVQVARDVDGKVRTRPTPSGCAARLWEITEAGREYLKMEGA